MLLAKVIRNFPEVVRRTLFFYRSGFFSPDLSEQKFDRFFQGWHMIAGTRGYMRSMIENQCIDRDGKPIPWYTYPAIEQISKWDFSGNDVLEYGSGNSTLWWAERARSVTSIESDEGWYMRIRSRMPSNCNLILSPVPTSNDPGGNVEEFVTTFAARGKYKAVAELDRYAHVVDTLGRFDVVVIDGEASNFTRLECTRNAIGHLQQGGVIIVDNADWHPETCRLLREAGFLEVDFCGLSPLNPYASTTSLFFRRDFCLRPRGTYHPGHTLGGYEWNREAGASTPQSVRYDDSPQSGETSPSV